MNRSHKREQTIRQVEGCFYREYSTTVICTTALMLVSRCISERQISANGRLLRKHVDGFQDAFCRCTTRPFRLAALRSRCRCTTWHGTSLETGARPSRIIPMREHRAQTFRLMAAGKQICLGIVPDVFGIRVWLEAHAMSWNHVSVL